VSLCRSIPVRVRACVCAFVRACVRACVCVRVCVGVRAFYRLKQLSSFREKFQRCNAIFSPS
jgi:hypothetical protein